MTSPHTFIASEPVNGTHALMRTVRQAALHALPRGYQLDRRDCEITPGEASA